MQKQSKAAMLEKKAKKQQATREIGICLLLFLLLIAMAYGANNRIEVSEYTYRTNALSVSFNQFRIVQLSDLHSKMFQDQNADLLREVRVPRR